MRKLNILASVLLGCMLASCNHGGTVETVTPQRPQGTTFELLNETKSVISSIKIKDDHGNLIYSKEKLNCQPDDFCEIATEDLKLKSSYDAFFFNRALA